MILAETIPAGTTTANATGLGLSYECEGYFSSSYKNNPSDIKNQEVKLAKKEILLFNLFAKNLEKVITFEQIEQYVWEGDLTTNENIRALIKRLRKKVPNDTIISQGGMGYILNANKTL